MSETSLLFGYGTIRSDLGSYSHPPYHIRSLGLGRTPGELWRISNAYGVWAGVKELKKTKATVLGEVFEVKPEQWVQLDQREQACVEPPFYYRKVVPVTLVSGEVVQAQIYFAGHARTSWLQRIPSGDWADFFEET